MQMTSIITVPPITATGRFCVLRASGLSISRFRLAISTTIGSTIGINTNGNRTDNMHKKSVLSTFRKFS